jgi:hypothetical protein
VIPPDTNAGFVAAMEDVLETYQKPRDPDRPLVCLDETSKQLIVETRAPIAPVAIPSSTTIAVRPSGATRAMIRPCWSRGWRYLSES